MGRLIQTVGGLAGRGQTVQEGKGAEIAQVDDTVVIQVATGKGVGPAVTAGAA